MADLPCDGDGLCMRCRVKPAFGELLECCTCHTPWHLPCLSAPPEPGLAELGGWPCPDCSDLGLAAVAPAPPAGGEKSGLLAAVREIEMDDTIDEKEKARRRQKLLGGAGGGDSDGEGDGKRKNEEKDVMKVFEEEFICAICLELCDRPVTTPCGHNFCLKCLQKSMSQGKKTCVKCRKSLPAKMAEQPKINLALVAAIRSAKTASNNANLAGAPHVYHYIHNEDRPEKAFTTGRAKKTGKANACSGKIFVSIPTDYFGPILAEHDKRNRGVLVGDSWADRLECRQWGAHFPHVAGIAGQADYGAQSVALSGGYEDDEDHGEWFLYTGSGGRDLSGNKRTNKDQSFDQKFEKSNEALRVSCLKGYPVRVVRSHKEKRSSYSPESGVRYDGVYRIEKCWRKVGIQGFKVCRYLFVRCDNAPAPWTSDDRGDLPRPIPEISELKDATNITERKESPSWDYDEKEGWKWMKQPPPSQKIVDSDGKKVRRYSKREKLSHREAMLQAFSCSICKNLMKEPVTTPCAHNFCKSCLLNSYADKSFVRERTREGGRSLRSQKIVKKCPICPVDIAEFLQNPQVCTDIVNTIERLKAGESEVNEQAEGDAPPSEGSDLVGNSGEDGDVVADGEDKEEEGIEDGAEAAELKMESADGDSDVNVTSEKSEDADDDEEPKRSATRKRRATKATNASDDNATSETSEDGDDEEEPAKQATRKRRATKAGAAGAKKPKTV